MSKDSKTDYDKYLALLHDKHTSEEIIIDTVKAGTGKDIQSKQKIIAGEVNEVYDITLINNEHVILRISPKDFPEFQQEQWAIKQVKNVGVPVPNILLINYLTIDEKPYAFCLMEKVDGEPLERGSIDFNSLPMDQRKAYIIQAGEILTRIHSIQTQGFGWIIGKGDTEFKTSDELLDKFLNKRETYYSIADKENIERKDIDKAFAIIKALKTAYAKVNPVLNHGDYGHKHLMVKGDKITGILDWGGVRSDTPIFDFARWDYWFGDYVPTEWLKEGYQNKALFNAEFDMFLHMLRIYIGLDVLKWYHRQGYKSAVDESKAKLIKDLEYFN